MKVLQGLCLLERDEDPFLDQLSARTAELFGVSCHSCRFAATSERATAVAGSGSPRAAWSAGWLPGALLEPYFASTSGHAVHCYALLAWVPSRAICAVLLAIP